MRRTLLASLAVLLLALAAVDARAADRIDTVAGGGDGGFAGDGGVATSALLTAPSDVAPLGAAGEAYLIADTSNHRIRRVDATGVITTVAGAGPCCGAASGFAGSGVAATDPSVRLNQPRGVAALPGGGFLIADTFNHRIRRVDASGTITTVAGIGSATFGGDGGPAAAAFLRSPGGVAALPDGGFLIADTGNDRIRRVDASGTITTVAGNAFSGALGDGGPAASATLSAPARVVPLAGGGFLIADTGHHRVRRVDAAGTITTVAGHGTAGFAGDGGPATAAALNEPEGVSVRADGAIAIADAGNERIREVDPAGVIRTIAGTGALGFSGDGGPPGTAQLSRPRALAYGAGRVWIADALNHRVRAIAPEPTTTPPPRRAPDPPPPIAVPPGVAPAVLGRSAVAAPVGGTIRIRLPGRRRFVRLGAVANVPLGSELDATRGRVSLLFATTRGARSRSASVVASEGRFVVRQPRRLDRGQRPGSLVLSGPLAGCRAAVRRGAARRPLAGAAKKRAKRKRKGRRVKVHAQGRIEVSGRYGAAIVRGTRWTTIDRCPRDPRPGTLFVVQEGRVAVTAFALRRRTLVTRGRRYLAPARAGARAPARARARAKRRTRRR
ncbi:hypothetical protein [Conexibacter arvalis]|uniref:Teneurin NHL domain-containing protein n=1 Tax=Conexibacter arvalis TaxID=912552 RepID=A0A840ILZ3_9ACTN|nr:hypothetical protein [Conexibacter arvalis]MBB4664958.1 hypothetical protein [Conexibacter arvalis]